MGTKSRALFYISGFFLPLRLSEYFKTRIIFHTSLYLTDYQAVENPNFRLSKLGLYRQ